MISGTVNSLNPIPLAAWAKSLKRSPLHERLMQSSNPDLISFGLGLPASELFPTAAIARAFQQALSGDGQTLQYGAPSEQLKRHIVEIMKRRGVQSSTDEVHLISGAQQGLSLLAHLFMEEGGNVVMEQASYPGFNQTLQVHSCRVSIVRADLETGFDVDELGRLLARGLRPRLLYIMTEHHNPLGVSLTYDKRARLAELVRQYGIPVIEDDAYGFLSYEGGPLPPLKAFAPEWVCYVGSFSKIVAPALRTGWVILPPALAFPFSILKFSSDLDSCSLGQRVISLLLDGWDLWSHVGDLCREYRARRDAMLSALSNFSRLGARWTRPRGGLFVWVELAQGTDTTALLPLAVRRENVAFMPGQAFASCPDVALSHCLRLNFSNSPVERIQEGVHRLSALFEAAGPCAA
jgi:2-aminoadipate transaminase